MEKTVEEGDGKKLKERKQLRLGEMGRRGETGARFDPVTRAYLFVGTHDFLIP